MSKYIIEIEDEPFGRNDDPNIPHGMDELFKAKCFNALVFDKEGLDKLTPFDKALNEAYLQGKHDAEQVQSSYGRLIDADALIAKKRKLYCDNCILRVGFKNGKKQFLYEIGAAPCRGCWIDDMVTELQDSPTIIEAERNEE